jgi:ubiquinone biosynthesis protein COQ4
MAVADIAAPQFDPDAFRLRPGQALRALGRLLNDPDDTVAVFDIMRALSGRSIPKGYLRLLNMPSGGRIAFEQAELAQIFCDDAWLAQCPPGSVGAAYRAFVQTENISAEGLAAESRASRGSEIDQPHPYAWYARRLRDVHDVWHVLSGYGRDPMGEVCVVAFSYAQTRSAGFALIAAGGARKISKERPGLPIGRAVWEAYQRGRTAAWLPGEDYQRLFMEPLASARARLGIGPIRYPIAAQ